jgi:YVTN family beta-propeller protein
MAVWCGCCGSGSFRLTIEVLRQSVVTGASGGTRRLFMLRVRSTTILSVALVLVALLLSASASGSAASARQSPPTIGVGSNPIDLAVSPANAFAYVANDGSMSVVDLATRTQTAEVATGNVTDQTAIGVVERGTKVYIGTFDRPTLTVMSATEPSVLRTVKIGRGATAIAQAANGLVYVSSLTGKRVVVLNGRTDTVVSRVRLPAGAQYVAASARQAWVGSAVDGRLWVVNTSTNRTVRTVLVPQVGPIQGIAFAKGGGSVWVSGLGGVSVIDRASGKARAFLSITRIFPKTGPNTGPIALNPSGTRALVLNSTFPDAPQAGTVAFINTRTLAVTKRITLGTEPTGIAVDRKRGTAYVTNYGDDTLSYFPATG